jgi:TPR repeat protein
MNSLNLLAKATIAAIALGLSAQPAVADVKAGVDAWTRGEYDKAVKEWRDPALKGDSDAQFNMGQAYKLGRGVKADLDVAADWYLRAARAGHLQAGDAYGHLLHYRGKVAEALPYLQASADRGEPRAQYLLATELFNGSNTAKDWVKAYAYMTRASSAGLSPASRSLAQMDQHIPLEQRQQGIALAGQIEQQAGKARNDALGGFPIDTKPPAKVAKAVAVPPSVPAPSANAPGFPGVIPPMPGETPVYKPAPTPVTKPDPVALATPTPVAGQGNWRIQLGAFGNEANAQKLWNSLESKIDDLASLTPYLKAAGSVTRLQAGPFATRASAEAMCSKVKMTGQACIVTTN